MTPGQFSKNDVALRVLANMPGNRLVGISMTLIIIIIRVVTFLIMRYGPCLVKCYKNRIGFFKWFGLRQMVKRAFREDAQTRCEFIADFREHGNNMIQALLKTAQQTTTDEIKSLIELELTH